ncbi:MAG TPA: aminotransferase class III-fold pyridoxal phosphate-dependent enzyme, partial [Bacillus sp. (in: firmicutes)]|nr:aminotransferase class III-fold pyridoxal phosphate-dependent enzyme [Bacillus sp. (in: firmicutes)]
SKVNEKADFLKSILEETLLEISIVNEIRGLGFMIGIEVNTPVPAILASLRTKGLIALSAGENVIRLLPPLTASKEELQMALDIITTALKKTMETAV